LGARLLSRPDAYPAGEMMRQIIMLLSKAGIKMALPVVFLPCRLRYHARYAFINQTDSGETQKE